MLECVLCTIHGGMPDTRPHFETSLTVAVFCHFKLDVIGFLLRAQDVA